MSEINPSAKVAEIVATLSDLSNKQCSSSEDEKNMQSILSTARFLSKNPEELKKFLANLASLDSLSSGLRGSLSDLLVKVDELCKVEKKMKVSPKDPRLVTNARKIEACVNAKLTQLECKANEKLTAYRVSCNDWTTAENNVVAISKAILQR